MWPGFKSRRRRHMWVEFVVGSLPCSERFFTGYSGFPHRSPQKPTFPGIRPGIRWTKNHYVDVLPAIVIYLFILFIYKTCFQNQRIFCRKKVNARWIQPRFGRKHIYLIQPCQNEKVSIRFNILNLNCLTVLLLMLYRR